MAWIRIDDHFDEHPKLAQVGPLGWGIWLAGLAYCNRNLTDGFIPRAVAKNLCDDTIYLPGGELQIALTSGMAGHDFDGSWSIEIMLQARLWDEAVGGYQVHDYLDFQPSRAEVEEARRLKQAAGQAGGKATAAARAQAGAAAERKQALKQKRSKAAAESQPKPKEETQTQEPAPEPEPLPKYAEPHPDDHIPDLDQPDGAGAGAGELERLNPHHILEQARR